jgi:hypothetical protein
MFPQRQHVTPLAIAIISFSIAPPGPGVCPAIRWADIAQLLLDDIGSGPSSGAGLAVGVDRDGLRTPRWISIDGRKDRACVVLIHCVLLSLSFVGLD